eukprot:scaffold1052_cov115-Skeletonema_menzelii.AAC.1
MLFKQPCQDYFLSMGKHVHRKSGAAAEESVEIVATTGHNFSGFIGYDHHNMSFELDPEMPTAVAADPIIGLDGDDFASANRRNGGARKRWLIGAMISTAFLLVIVAIVFIKQPADNTSLASAAAAKRVANNNLLAECCVNIATNTCHATDKCNKKEKECEKCNKKTSDEYSWMLPGGSPPPPVPVPPEPRQPDNGGGTTDEDVHKEIEIPCCAIIATNTCHEDNKCNQQVKNCENKKCQKNGVAVWQVPSKQSPAPTSAPSNSPTPKPSTSAPSPTPTSSPTDAPTNPVPATPAPTGAPTLSTPAPSKNPTTAPTATVDSTVYEYTNTGKSCSIGGGDNVQGPAPLPDKRNVMLDFWAWGDSPYDYMVDTCLDENENLSTCNECKKENGDIDEMPYPNTCTFEGADFKCVKESIIPFMNGKMDQGDGAFQVHLGDILKGTNAAANSRRCTPASFDSRAKLFQPAKNFLLINGDNESNECMGYDINTPTDPVREMWRERFGQYLFTSDFPAITGGGRPT